MAKPIDKTALPSLDWFPGWPRPLYRKVSGTYRGSYKGMILELRVDVDGLRHQHRLSGDLFEGFKFLGDRLSFPMLYKSSFVVEKPTIEYTSEPAAVITGPVTRYNNPTRVGDKIEVTIPLVPLSSSPADATVKYASTRTLGWTPITLVCPKISEFFRKVTLEIDRFQTAIFPPTANTCNATPHPTDLTCEDMTTHLIFRRAGIDMTVDEDDVLNDPDSPDPGSNWDMGELHDLMETRFDHFANRLQWNLYGLVVPRFGVGDTYNSGLYGVMFDFGGYQPGDTYLRQGLAVAHDALIARTSDTLYSTAAQRDRLFLETFVHEVGHAFNLPHTWSRSVNPDSASNSFMNYPWGYTGGGGTTTVARETNFWSDFRWEFDDVELIWMRHAARNDVIFGGNDWIGDNLSIFTEPEREIKDAPLSLEVRAQEVFDYAQPVQVELKLKNISNTPQTVTDLLEPEDGCVAIYAVRPNGDRTLYLPPLRRLMAPKEVTLAPKESIYETVMMSYGAKGPQFQQPGEYRIRAYYNIPDMGLIVSPSCRLRVATPKSHNTEELAHLLFSHAAAKFMYFGGSERYPQTTSLLEEAAKKYEKSDPSVTAHINAALGKHQSHPFKKTIQKNGKRLITLRKANLEKAILHLEAARKLLPTRTSALDNISYNRLSLLLVDCYKKQKKTKEAIRTLQESLQYLQKRKVIDAVLDNYQSHIRKLTKSTK